MLSYFTAVSIKAVRRAKSSANIRISTINLLLLHLCPINPTQDLLFIYNYSQLSDNVFQYTVKEEKGESVSI